MEENSLGEEKNLAIIENEEDGFDDDDDGGSSDGSRESRFFCHEKKIITNVFISGNHTIISIDCFFHSRSNSFQDDLRIIDDMEYYSKYIDDEFSYAQHDYV